MTTKIPTDSTTGTPEPATGNATPLIPLPPTAARAWSASAR